MIKRRSVGQAIRQMVIVAVAFAMQAAGPVIAVSMLSADVNHDTVACAARVRCRARVNQVLPPSGQIRETPHCEAAAAGAARALAPGHRGHGPDLRGQTASPMGLVDGFAGTHPFSQMLAAWGIRGPLGSLSEVSVIRSAEQPMPTAAYLGETSVRCSRGDNDLVVDLRGARCAGG
jgi:hypothetical protein